MLRLLVTGGAGFIGSHYIRRRLSQYPEDEVLNLDLLTYAGNPANLEDVVRDFGERYEFVRGDIANSELVAHLVGRFRPEVVVNFAAESHNSRALTNPDSFYRTNVLGTQVLLEAARVGGVQRFHHVSTCEVYGQMSLDETRGFTEDAPVRPRTPYNASKAGGDLAVRAYWETYELPITISNCGNNFGSHQFPEKVIPHFTVRALTGRKLPIYQSSHHKREWLHVSDHCAAIDRILSAGRVGETYNIGSEVEADVEMIADAVLRTLGLEDSYREYVADRPGHDSRYLLDSKKIRDELGWSATVPFEEGVADTIRWYRDNQDWWQPLLERLTVNEESWRAAPMPIVPVA